MRGLQFIAVQTTPEEQSFAGFWMLRDIPMA
ncbi:MAG: Tab2 family RNA-binding protein [Synechococcus sp.]